MKKSCFETALLLFALGAPLVFTQAGEKGPNYRDWHRKLFTLEEIKSRFATDPNLNVGVLLGPRSGLIDIEGDDPSSETDLLELFDGQSPLTTSWQSQRGIHRLFLYDERLARLGKAVLKYKSLEIRVGAAGKAAQSLLPPSKTNGVVREWICPLWETKPAELPDFVVEKLLSACTQKTTAKSPAKSQQYENDVADDYVARASWKDILEPHGWLMIGDCDGVQHWKRPGKVDNGLSATTGYCTSADGRDLFYCFSDNAPPFEKERAYNKFTVYALLNHDSDFKAATAALRKQGYGTPQSLSMSAQLLSFIDDCHLCHTPSGDPHITCPVEDHLETYAVDARSFKRWLEHRYFKETGGAPSTKAMTEVTGVVSARARFDGDESPVFTRVAGHGDSIYLDLADEQWKVVEVTSEGWSVVNHVPVKFRRPTGLLRLTTPEVGGPIDELRHFVNVDDDSWPLLVAGLVAALRPVGPYPIMAFLSEHGSGKSTTMRCCRELIDPNGANLRPAPKDVQTLMLSAHNGWFVALDNLSGVSPWLSDALCRVATGGGLSARTLYTNDEETLFDCQRPTMVTGITDLTDRPDFLDRCLLITCPPMPDDRRRDEATFRNEWQSARPRILGSLLSAVSVGLKNLPSTQPERLPRMADFARWLVAAETGLGWAPGTFMAAYERNRRDASQMALDNPLANAVQKLVNSFVELSEITSEADHGRIDGSCWKGTATQLLNLLNEHLSSERDRSSQEWPKASNVLSGKIRRMQVDLRTAGILVTQKRRTITIDRV